MRLKYVLSEVLVGLWRNVTMTIAMIITMSVSLTMLGASALLYLQANEMKDFYYANIEVAMFLKADVNDEQRQSLDAQLSSDGLVQSYELETKEKALEKFQTLWRDTPDLVKSVSAEQLPESFRVKLNNPEQYEDFATKYASAEASTRSSTSARCWRRCSASSTRSRPCPWSPRRSWRLPRCCWSVTPFR